MAYRIWTEQCRARRLIRDVRGYLTQAARAVVNSLTLAEMPAKHIAGFVLVAILQLAPPRRTEGRMSAVMDRCPVAERFPQQ